MAFRDADSSVRGRESLARGDRCRQARHERRTAAHRVDVAPRTADPDRALRPGPESPSPPERPLTPFLPARRLDDGSAMRALVGTLASLDASDDVEDPHPCLSRKVR